MWECKYVSNVEEYNNNSDEDDNGDGYYLLSFKYWLGFGFCVYWWFLFLILYENSSGS